MTRFAERQNKKRAVGKKNKNGNQNSLIPYQSHPRNISGDFILSADWGLSYTRKQALGRYRILVKSGHHPKAVLDSFSRQTFPNKYLSIVYHVRKHGQGMKAGEYAEAALAFFIENYYRAKIKQDRLGKWSWNIRGVIGGWWTKAGRIITYWF